MAKSRICVFQIEGVIVATWGANEDGTARIHVGEVKEPIDVNNPPPSLALKIEDLKELGQSIVNFCNELNWEEVG